jgi:glycine cleavage system H protein
MLRFTKDHEWLRAEGDLVTFGITSHAQEQLGDIVFVELPSVGATLTQGTTAAVVESVKAASDVYAPISGEVIEVNTAIVENPKLINDDPMGQGWFAKLRVSDSTQVETLMDEQAYRSLIE